MVHLLVLILLSVGVEDTQGPTFETRQHEFRGRINRLGENLRQWIKERREKRDIDINDDTSDVDDEGGNGGGKRRRRWFDGELLNNIREWWNNREKVLFNGSFFQNAKIILLVLMTAALLYIAWPIVVAVGKMTRILTGRWINGI